MREDIPALFADGLCLPCVVEELALSSSQVDARLSEILRRVGAAPGLDHISDLGAIADDWEKRVIAAIEICQLQREICYPRDA